MGQQGSDAPKLVTAPTARYLFAISWLPRDLGEEKVLVPEGDVNAVPAAVNLLHCAL